jgi:hypothetical protein
VNSKTFSIKVSEYSLPANISIYLRDKILHSETLMSKSGDQYGFEISPDTITKGDYRFELVTRPGKPVSATLDASADEIRFLPNPFREELTIALGAGAVTQTGTTVARLIDMQGRVFKVVTTGPNTKLLHFGNTGNLVSGAYIVEIKNDKISISKQVIKQ